MNPTELSPSTKIFELALRNQTFSSKEKALGFLRSLGRVIQVSRECHNQFSTNQFLNLMIQSIGNNSLALIALPDMQAVGWNPKAFLKTRLCVLNNWVLNQPGFHLQGKVKVTPFCALYETSQKIDLFMLYPKGILRTIFYENGKCDTKGISFPSFVPPRINCPGFFASSGEWHATVNAHNLILLYSDSGAKTIIQYPETIEIQQIELNQDFLFIRCYNTETKTHFLNYSKYQALEQKDQSPPKIGLTKNTTWLHVLKNELLFIERKEKDEKNYFCLSSISLDQFSEIDSSDTPRYIWKLSDEIQFAPFILSSNDMLYTIYINQEGRLFINQLKICSEKIEICEISSPIYKENQMILTEIWSASYHLDKVFIYGLMNNPANDEEKGPIVISYDLETQTFSKPNLPGSCCIMPDIPFFDNINDGGNQAQLKLPARFFHFDNDKVSFVYPGVEAFIPKAEDQQNDAQPIIEFVVNFLMLDYENKSMEITPQAQSAPEADTDTPLMLQ